MSKKPKKYDRRQIWRLTDYSFVSEVGDPSSEGVGVDVLLLEGVGLAVAECLGVGLCEGLGFTVDLVGDGLSVR